MNPVNKQRPARRLWRVLLALAILVSAPPALFAQELPEWMEYWEFGFNADEDEGPSYFADVLVPLYRNEERTRVLFLEPRVRFQDSEYLINSGIGFRQLVRDRAWVVGANMFHDYETTQSHYRLGWGLEALSAFAEARTNIYLGLSQQRLVEEHTGGASFEEAVNGWDFELGAPVPHYSRLKVFGGFNWYNYEEFDNRYGWTLRTEYTPVPFLVVDGLLSNDTKSNVDWGVTVAIRIPFGDNPLRQAHSPLQLDEAVFPESDASRQLYRLVERHHEIVVERRRETGGMSVEVARGT